MCKAQKLRYKHIDMSDLEDKLRSSSGRIKMIVTDGAFSMDGDVAPLRYCETGHAFVGIFEGLHWHLLYNCLHDVVDEG